MAWLARLLGLKPSLHAHAAKGNATGLRDLLDQGTDVGARDRKGNTALHLAVSKGHVALAEMLLQAGADVEAQNTAGQTALDIAISKGFVQPAQVLLNAGARPPPHALPKAYHNLEMAKLLISRGADVNVRAWRGGTLLHRAATHGRVPIASLLLNAGADIDARDDDGRTPLHTAVVYALVYPHSVSRYIAFIRLLAQKGADVNAADSRTLATPLHTAALRAGDRAPSVSAGRQVIDVLLDAGADAEAMDLLGNTPDAYAVSPEIASMLRNRSGPP